MNEEKTSELGIHVTQDLKKIIISKYTAKNQTHGRINLSVSPQNQKKWDKTQKSLTARPYLLL